MDTDRPKFEKLTIKNKVHTKKERCICQLCSCGEHKCQQFETATLPTTTQTSTGNEDAKQDVSQKNMPTQLLSTNLNNIESSSSQANTNLQSIGKWNTTPEHIQQVTNNIEKHQQQTQNQQQKTKDNQTTIKSVTRHHLPPVTRKTILGPVPQARSSVSHHLKSSELERNANFKAIYQPIPHPMAAYSSNGQEWIVTKQRIQRPKDHDILTVDPITSNQYVNAHLLTDADIKRNEFIERKIAQEQYRQQLEQQIMQQRPVKPFIPRTTLRFDGETEFKTETRQNYKPFRFVTSLNDSDKNGMNDRISKQSIEKEHHSSQNIVNSGNDQQNLGISKSNRPQSSLTGAKFKEHLQNQQDTLSQRRHLNQINQLENEQQQLQQLNACYEQQYTNDLPQKQPIEVDENNNVIEQRPKVQYKNGSMPKSETFCCDHCRHHYLNGINVPLGSNTNQNQIELNPLVGVRASQANKQMNRVDTGKQTANRKPKINEQQAQQMVRSKSTHFAPQPEVAIPRMIVPGKQKPHKNQSHLKFEGQNCFVTTNNLMYRDHSMQNLNSSPGDEYRHLNRGVFAEQMISSNGAKKSITGNIRGKVKNKYRDLFASSEDIFGNQDQKQQQQYQNHSNRLSVKYKSAVNLPQVNDEYDNRYYVDDQQLDKYKTTYKNDDNYENAYQNDYDNEYATNYNYPVNYSNEYEADEQIEKNEEQWDEEGENNLPLEKKLIFVHKDQPPTTHSQDHSGFERRREVNTTNSAYGSALCCPALNLASDKNNQYEYRYTIGNHKYFSKKNSLS